MVRPGRGKLSSKLDLTPALSDAERERKDLTVGAGLALPEMGAEAN
jgi:hypothetical protein